MELLTRAVSLYQGPPRVHKEILSVGLQRRPAAGEPVRVQALQSGIKATQSH